MRLNLVPFLALALTVTAACGSSTDTSTSSSSSGGVPVDPPGPQDPSATAIAAVFFGSCVPDDGISRILNYIYTHRSNEPWFELASQYTACLAGKSNGCEAVKDCLGLTFDLTGPCSAACNGTVLQSCENSIRSQIDCAMTGRTCSAEAEACLDELLGPACDHGTYVASCKDGVPIVCNFFEKKGPTCADLGLVCSTTSAPISTAGCTGTGPACGTTVGLSGLGVNLDDGIACAGTDLRACVNGREHQLDCGTVAKGFTCQTSGTASFCGLEGACTPGVAQAGSCDGDSVVFCNAGRIEKIDCKSLGFTGCNPQDARCIPNVYAQL